MQQAAIKEQTLPLMKNYINGEWVESDSQHSVMCGIRPRAKK